MLVVVLGLLATLAGVLLVAVGAALYHDGARLQEGAVERIAVADREQSSEERERLEALVAGFDRTERLETRQRRSLALDCAEHLRLTRLKAYGRAVHSSRAGRRSSLMGAGLIGLGLVFFLGGGGVAGASAAGFAITASERDMGDFELRPGFFPSEQSEAFEPIRFVALGTSSSQRAKAARDYAREVLTLARNEVFENLAAQPGREPPQGSVSIRDSGFSLFSLKKRQTWTVRTTLVVDDLLRVGEIEEEALVKLSIDALLAEDWSKAIMIDFDDDAHDLALLVAEAMRRHATAVAETSEFMRRVRLEF